MAIEQKKARKFRRITQKDAIQERATTLVACLRKAKNLTPLQKKLTGQLWDIMTKWDYVKKHLIAYNLEDSPESAD